MKGNGSIHQYAIYRAMISENYKSGINFMTPFKKLVYMFIEEDNASAYTIKELCSAFSQGYGIEIPDSPMRTIVSELCNEKILKKKHNKAEYHVLKRGVEIDLVEQKNEYEKKYDYLVQQLYDYIRKKGVKVQNLKEAEQWLLSFLQNQSYKLGTNEYNHHSQQMYVTGAFIETLKKDTSEYKLIQAINMGTLLTEYVSLNVENSHMLEQVELVLDTPFLCHLLGICLNNDMLVYSEMISTIVRNGGTLKVFSHSLNELEQILTVAAYWIEREDINLEKASLTLNYYLEMGARKVDIEEDIASLSRRISEYGIEVIDTSNVSSADSEKLLYFQAEKEIYDSILEEYKNTRFISDEDVEQMKTSIELDARSLNYVYIRRQGIETKTIQGSRCIFVTTNPTLAYASKKYHGKNRRKSDIDNEALIPPCITDVFLGTAIWLNNPIKIRELANSQLISQIIAAFQPGTNLYRAYLKELKVAEENGNIPMDLCYMLRSSPVVKHLLMETTLGDARAVTQQTPLEILNQFKTDAKIEAREKVRKEYEEKQKRLEKDALRAKEETQRMRDESIEAKASADEASNTAGKEKQLRIEKIRMLKKEADKNVKRNQTIVTSFLVFACILIIAGIIIITCFTDEQTLLGKVGRIFVILSGIPMLWAIISFVASIITSKDPLKISGMAIYSAWMEKIKKKGYKRYQITENDLKELL